MFSELPVLLYMCVFILCYFFIQSQYFSKKRQFVKQVGGPPGYPLVGSALEFLKNLDRTLFTVSKWIDEYGGRFAFFFGPALVFVISEVEDLEKVLTSTTLIEKSEEYDMVKDWLGEGLITSTGQHWLQRRKLLTPTFHFSILERFVGPINSQAKILVDNLHTNFILEGKGEFIDICPFVAKCALDVICETSMGIQLNAQKGSEESKAYVNAVHRMGELFQYRSIRPWMRSPFLWKITARGREEIECLKIIHSFTDRVISDRKRALSSIGEDKNQDEINGKVRLALLDLLIDAQKSGKDISEMGIREETTTFIFAAHDTTSVAISFFLFNIGNYPEVQEKLHREMDAIFQGDMSRNVTLADIREMKYLECCIKESLRLFPSVPMIGRQVTRDFKLDENTVVPSGTALYIIPFKVHRQSKHFARPEEYIPERFAAGSCMANRNPFSYIPFSASHRNCIGQKLAMMEIKILLSMILRRFKIKAQAKPEELELLSEIVLRAKGGLKLSLQER